MVIANDEMPRTPPSSGDDQSKTSHRDLGTHDEPRTYNHPGPIAKTGRRVTIERVMDDFGERIEIRFGEVVILGPLLDSVLEELRAKRANKG